MYREKDESKHYAQHTGDDVGYPQKVILSAEPRCRRYHKALGAPEISDRVV